jgi:hypothetical protein
MTKAVNTEAIEKATFCKWADWVKLLDTAGGKDLPHNKLAELAHAKMPKQLENPGWWAQSVAVAYEQHTGKRAPGQRADGTFELSVSRSLPGSLAQVMETWTKAVEGRDQFDGVSVVGEAGTSETKINLHWGINLEDGSRVNADVNNYGKATDKASLVVTHVRLKSAEAAQRWREYWKAFLQEL